MSQDIITALISVAGSILGSVIGAYAQIYSAAIAATFNRDSSKDKTTPSKGKRTQSKNKRNSFEDTSSPDDIPEFKREDNAMEVKPPALIQKKNSTWIGILAGGFIGGAILLLILWEMGFVSSTKLCDDYEIKITSPVSGEKALQKDTLIQGTYSSKPENAQVWIFSIERARMQFRPKAIVTLNDDGTWVSKISYLGDAGNKVELLPVVVGENGKILVDYHLAVGRDTNVWYAIPQLPNDVSVCSSNVTLEIAPSP